MIKGFYLLFFFCVMLSIQIECKQMEIPNKRLYETILQIQYKKQRKKWKMFNHDDDECEVLFDQHCRTKKKDGTSNYWECCKHGFCHNGTCQCSRKDEICLIGKDCCYPLICSNLRCKT